LHPLAEVARKVDMGNSANLSDAVLFKTTESAGTKASFSQNLDAEYLIFIEELCFLAVLVLVKTTR
jgi:hypothetical protein